MMTESGSAPITNQILCNQCTAVLAVEPGSQFVICEFCGTTNFVDKSQTILHYTLRATVDAATATAALRRWMGGNQTVKDLDKKAQIESPVFQLFPMWFLRVRQGSGEKIMLEPAAAISVIDLTDFAIPAADLELYDYTLDTEAIQPTVPLATVKKWLAENQGIAAGEIRENSLVHLPIFLLKYSFEGRTFTAVVDAASSQVFANVFPSKKEVPYIAIGSVGCALYFCAALIPGLSFLDSGSGGLLVGVGIYILAAIVLAIPIFAIAAYISSRV